MRRTIAQVIIVQLLLSGCAAQPLVVGNDAESGAADILRVSTQPPSASPYLRGRRSVPVEAQRRFALAQALIEKKEWQGALLELQDVAESYPRFPLPTHPSTRIPAP